MIKGFPHYQQLDEMDCGSTSLRMIAKYYGKEYSAEMLRNHCHITRNRSEEHTSELQSRFDLVCRLLLEKKKQ
mgnify:CR=1 FL=1